MSRESTIDKSELIEFANRCNKKPATVEKRFRNGDIPGIQIINNRFKIMEGTRYPYDMRGKETNNASKKRFYLIDAIFNRKYIDAIMLGVEQQEFNQYIQENMNAGLIMHMDWQNQYGANGFITTSEGDKIFTNQKKEQHKYYAELLGTVLGSAAKQIMSA